MFNPFRRKRQAATLPRYTELQTTRSRTLPQGLVAKEAASTHLNRVNSLEHEIFAALSVNDERHAFTAVIGGGRGPVTLTSHDGSGADLLLFTSPVRAMDYVDVQLNHISDVQYLASTFAQALGMLKDLKGGTNIGGMAVDRCPRCNVTMSFALDSVKTESDLMHIFSIAQGTNAARTELYLQYAMTQIAAGELGVAQDVLLETVGHVSMEDPRCHVLLGQIAIALGDRKLGNEARSHLRFLRVPDWESLLDKPIDSVVLPR